MTKEAKRTNLILASTLALILGLDLWAIRGYIVAAICCFIIGAISARRAIHE